MEVKVNPSHMVTIDNRKKMMITAVIEVVSATEKCVIAKITDKTMYIMGRDLRIAKLSLEEGLLILEGEIENLKYQETASSRSFFKKVFK